MADYHEMMRQLRADRWEQVEKAIREAAFESEHGIAYAFPKRWKETSVRKYFHKRWAQAKVEANANDLIAVSFVKADMGAGTTVSLHRVRDEDLLNLSNLKWYPRDPLPPLVVLAKCSAGNLSSDRASREWKE